MIRARLAGLLAAALTFALPTAQAQDAVLNLYSARHYQTDEALYANFTKATGIRIQRIEADDAGILARLKTEGAASPADVVLLVIRGDVPSVKRARRLLVALPGMGVSANRVHVVLNRDGQAGQLSLSQIESGLGQSVQHRIPDDPSRVNRAMNYGELVVASWGARISRSFKALAQELTGVRSENSWWPFA